MIGMMLKQGAIVLISILFTFGYICRQCYESVRIAFSFIRKIALKESIHMLTMSERALSFGSNQTY
jgi:hypothetical protein